MDDFDFDGDRRIILEPRPIKELELAYGPPVYVGGGWYNNRDIGTITKIVPFNEPGEMGYVVWFAVYVGDEIALRINGKYVHTIWYVEGKI